MDIYSTDIIEHSGLKYRIEMRQNQGIWQQRHIWYPAPSTYVTSETAESWIRSVGGPIAKMHIVKAPLKSRKPQQACNLGLFGEQQSDLQDLLK
jgi:hypothetical protein